MIVVTAWLYIAALVALVVVFAVAMVAAANSEDGKAVAFPIALFVIGILFASAKGDVGPQPDDAKIRRLVAERRLELAEEKLNAARAALEAQR